MLPLFLHAGDIITKVISMVTLMLPYCKKGVHDLVNF